MRFRKTFSTFLVVLAALFIGTTITLFLVFPRVVNELADRLGFMGYSEQFPFVQWDLGIQHAIIALVIDILLFYFLVIRPTATLRESLNTTGLRIKKGEGRAFIDTESVRQQVYAALAGIAEIRRAEVNIANDDGRAIINLNLVTDITLNGPRKKNEINREVRKIVEDQLGVELGEKPTINFSLVPMEPPAPLIGAGETGRAGRTEGTDKSRAAAPVAEEKPIVTPAPEPRPVTPEPPVAASPVSEPERRPVPPPMPEPEASMRAAAPPVIEPAPVPIEEEMTTVVESVPITAEDDEDDTAILTPPPSFERRPWSPPGEVTDLPEPSMTDLTGSEEDTLVESEEEEDTPNPDQPTMEG